MFLLVCLSFKLLNPGILSVTSKQVVRAFVFSFFFYESFLSTFRPTKIIILLCDQFPLIKNGWQDVNAVALQSYKVLSSPILISQVKAHWHIVYQASMVLVLGYRDHMLKTINPSVVRGLCDWTVELAKFMNKPLYFYDLMYEEWLWWSPLDREFVQLEGMHELNVSPPSLQNNVAIVGTSELTTEVQIALENLFESKTL